MQNIVQDLFNQLSGAPMQQMSRELGADESSIQKAVATALPLLLGTMGRNASTPEGADQLHRALERDHAASSPMDIIGGLLGDGGNSGAGGLLGSVLGSVLGGGSKPQNRALDAAGILGHVFGGRTDRAQRGVAQASGVNSDLAGKVLKYLAPVVMAYLANQMKSKKMSSRELGSALGSEQKVIQEQSPVGGLMGAVLDRDGDGDVDFMDMVGIGSTILGGMRR